MAVAITVFVLCVWRRKWLGEEGVAVAVTVFVLWNADDTCDSTKSLITQCTSRTSLGMRSHDTREDGECKITFVKNGTYWYIELCITVMELAIEINVSGFSLQTNTMDHTYNTNSCHYLMLCCNNVAKQRRIFMILLQHKNWYE